MTMKTTLTAALILTTVALNNPLLADSPVAAPAKGPFQSGFNVGGSLGVGFGEASLKSEIAAVHAGGVFRSAPPQSTCRKNGLAGNISGGYQHFEGEWMVGLDVAVGLNAGKFSETKKLDVALDMAQQVKNTWVVEPMVVAGRKIGDKVMIFGGVGPSIGFFKGSRTISSPGRPNVSGDFKETKTGFKGTVGADVALSKNISIAGSVSYTAYGSISAAYPSLNQVPVAGDKNSGTYKVSAITPAVTVRYHL